MQILLQLHLDLMHQLFACVCSLQGLIVLRKNVFIQCKLENDRSAVAVVTGKVK